MDCLKCYSRGCSITGSKEEDLRWQAIESAHKLDVYDYLEEIPVATTVSELVEVRFKNTRKEFYKNATGVVLHSGDVVAVEADHGHDIGIVSLTGELVREQLKKANLKEETFLKIYRKARPADIMKWKEAILMEFPTMIKTRQIASKLNLNMKVGDVEYQGDKSKVYFYYIADERVDFRELIKILKSEFKVTIRMVQIGARQEAARIGGIGPCGRELCCATWLSDFVSVTTTSARRQELSLNPQKLAGQCSKLKCCINYEVDTYVDAQKKFPKHYNQLETETGTLFYLKSDILKGVLWYSTDPQAAVNMISFTVDEVKEMLDLNRKGIKPPVLPAEKPQATRSTTDVEFVVSQDSLTRFDKGKPRNDRKKKRNFHKPKS
ncbi:MAG: hypothetical protein CVU05_13885 [Bacteroidetes bacterium HGW-Bacteroidetes-21]|jgi:cell fate regulator YaaT (PSP1 superfamily)|nr:MAG: hypothetical protein CVU05_13885 [Bacteroidetes bacterium HGW-Bacteroidetes-21]